MSETTSFHEGSEDRKFFVQKLVVLRDDSEDEIPETMIYDGPYKIRKNWFHGVCGILNNIRHAELLGSWENIGLIDGFIEKAESEEFKSRNTTQEDIKEANALIDLVIDELSKN